MNNNMNKKHLTFVPSNEEFECTRIFREMCKQKLFAVKYLFNKFKKL